MLLPVLAGHEAEFGWAKLLRARWLRDGVHSAEDLAAWLLQQDGQLDPACIRPYAALGGVARRL
eukprot:2589659-Lingulodinium_polyedra.AAC.1